MAAALARRAARGVVAGGLLLTALGLGLRQATRWIVEPAGGPTDHVFRRDAVRSLANQRAADEDAHGGKREARPAER